jgi:NAD(P)-dependent dehydrogenase (short-subunit alcohol dehydrogenase family)
MATTPGGGRASRPWTDADVPALDGQRFVVTGANVGLGFEAARVLARRGAQVTLAVRDTTKGRRALASILGELPSARADVARLDLADLASVRAFAETLAGGPALDGLVCNAGVMALPRISTANGFEMQMGTNHLGHFALVGLALPALLRARRARVAIVSSDLHRRGRVELLDDPFWERRPYGRWQAYAQSKLANLLMVLELDRRVRAAGSSIVVTGAHPGYAATELQARGPEARGARLEGWFFALSNALIAQSAMAGAWPILRAATDPDATGGEYYGPGRLRGMRGPAIETEPSAAARDVGAARRLWAWSEQVTGVRYDALVGTV